jgi:O-antigen/teichoic acid export membrane protein
MKSSSESATMGDGTPSTTRPTGLSLRANFSWTFAGNIANTLSQFGMLLALARLGSPEMTGQYGLALAITAPIFLFGGMSLRNVQVTDVHSDYSFVDYASIRALGMLVAVVATVVVSDVAAYPPTTTAVVVLIGISKAIEGMSDAIYGVFHKHEQMDIIAKSMMVRAFLSVVVFAAVLRFTGELVPSVLAMTIVWLIHLVVFDGFNLLQMKGRAVDLSQTWKGAVTTVRSLPSRRLVLWSLLVLSLPVGLSSFLISLSASFPRFILENSAGASELGIYTVLAYPLAAGNIVISALSQSSLPRLARHYSNRDTNGFDELLLRLLLLASGSAILSLIMAAWFGDEIISSVFGEQYAGQERVFLILVLGMGIGFLNWFINSSLHAMRAFRELLLIQLLVVVLVIGASMIVIPVYGLEGAAWVTAASAAVQVGCKAVIVKIKKASSS